MPTIEMNQKLMDVIGQQFVDQREWVKEQFSAVNSRLDKMDDKLDTLLECHGLDPKKTDSVLEKTEKAQKKMDEIQDGLRRHTEQYGK